MGVFNHWKRIPYHHNYITLNLIKLIFTAEVTLICLEFYTKSTEFFWYCKRQNKNRYTDNIHSTYNYPKVGSERARGFTFHKHIDYTQTGLG